MPSSGERRREREPVARARKAEGHGRPFATREERDRKRGAPRSRRFEGAQNRRSPRRAFGSDEQARRSPMRGRIGVAIIVNALVTDEEHRADRFREIGRARRQRPAAAVERRRQKENPSGKRR